MKIILVTLAFCALITTSRGQSALITNKAEKKDAAGEIDPKKKIATNILSYKLAHTFSKALKECGLVETFDNPGPISIFLPTDSAFSKLSVGRIDTLLMPQNKYNLISLLTYHALPGNVRAKDIAKHIKRGKGKTSLHTIAGAWLIAEFNNNGDIILTDEKGGKATLLENNIKQQNGMIHLISEVLMPNFRSI